jgi:hypothetical protein
LSPKHWSALTPCRFVVIPPLCLSALTSQSPRRPSKYTLNRVIGYPRRTVRHLEELPSISSLRSGCGMMHRGKLNNKCSKDQGKGGRRVSYLSTDYFRSLIQTRFLPFTCAGGCYAAIGYHLQWQGFELRRRPGRTMICWTLREKHTEAY